MKNKIIRWLVLLLVSAAAGIAAILLSFLLYIVFTGYGGVQDYDLPIYLVVGAVVTVGTAVVIAIKQACADICSAIKNYK